MFTWRSLPFLRPYNRMGNNTDSGVKLREFTSSFRTFVTWGVLLLFPLISFRESRASDATSSKGCCETSVS